MNVYDEIFASETKYNQPNRARLQLVLEWVRRNNFKQLLDVGCGRGNYIRFLEKHGFRVTGADPSQYICEKLGDVINSDILGLEGRWEALYCMDVLEHIPEEEVSKNLSHLAKLSDRALIGIANHNDRWKGIQLHLTRQGKNWWQEQLQSCYDEVMNTQDKGDYFIFEVSNV